MPLTNHGDPAQDDGMFKRRPAETLMAVFCAAAMAVLLFAASVTGCAHVDPGKFAQCMQDSGKGAAFINAVRKILDIESTESRTAVLEQLAISLTPAVVQCALEQIAASKGAGPVENQRAKRAREYLDSHGGPVSLSSPGIGPGPGGG